ncbi:MAG TPA: DUF4476 domain-containing protein [Planctomycetota bacterium]|nr:DUF4476 domain-containing protein [Planctomycetota bacterium]
MKNLPRPRAASSFLLAPVLLVTACCGGGSFAHRTGPDFAVAFPDTTVLVTTQDPAAVRARLAEVRLPETSQHHDELVALLRAQPTISAPHLILLAEAVALSDRNVSIYSDGHLQRTYPARGASEFAPVVDQLLVEGTPKLTGVDRRWLGELIGHTQGDAALRTLADRYVPGLDDGSETALLEMLDGMPGSPAMLPFLTAYMLPQGRLDGARGWAAVGHMPFDEQRVALIETLAARQPSIDATRALQTIGTLSFDAGRRTALAVLAAKIEPLSADVSRRLVATFSFDEGRQAAFATLAKSGLHLDDAQLVGLVALCSFDAGRLRCVELLAPCLQGEPTGPASRALLDAFSFDSDRARALRIMAARWQSLPVEARRNLLGSFSFDSNRAEAATALMQ